jgi:hypothetical protein
LTNGSSLNVQASIDGGATYLGGTSYYTAYWGWSSGGGAAGGNSNDSAISLSNGNSLSTATPDAGVSGSLLIYNVNSGAYKKIVGLSTWWDASTVVAAGQQGANIKTTSVVNAMRVIGASGNLTSGIVRLYGLAK